MDNFEEYKKQDQPEKKERCEIWQTAFGLQQVDGLIPSEYLIESAKENIDGKISISDIKERLVSYYREKPKNNEDDRTEEADKVSVRIVEILSEKTFNFSPEELIYIHKSLFDGIFVGGILNIKAGVFRDYNITKSEWVLNGKSVFYSSAKIIMNTLEYDFSLEKKFNYAGLNKEKIVEHIAQFISGIWQIHPFGEGNTRTIAVFTIKYLRTFGFEVNNELFEKNSWYFRNALVRANYSDYSLNIYSTYEYLNRFFANLLLGKNYKLKNRELRLYIKVGNDTVKVGNDTVKDGNDTVKDGNDTVKDVNDNVNDTVLSLILKNNKITAIELSNKLNKGIVTIKRELKRLKENNLIERVGSDKTGYWKVI